MTMDIINSKYNIALEVITPISIGAGAEKDLVKGIDFIVNNGRIYRIDLSKMQEAGIDIVSLSPYFANRDSAGILRLIGNKLAEVSDGEPLTLPAQSDNDIKAFIRNEFTGKPIVPGSSIKGAIRSILFEYLKDSNEKDEKTVFGKANDGNEFMRFIKFSDFEFDKTELINTKIFNLRNNNGRWASGWKNGGNSTGEFRSTGFNTLYESLLPKEVGCGSIMLSEKQFKIIDDDKHSHYNKKLRALSLKELFAIINSHTKNYLKKELDFFLHFQNGDQYTQKIIDNIQNLIKAIPDNNAYCIFKMSAGSGFHSITGDWQFDNYLENGKDRVLDRKRKGSLPKSRKIAIKGKEFALMGFVKMSIATDEQLASYNEKKEAERQKVKSAYERRNSIRKEAEKRKAAEERREQTYNSELTQAETLYNQNKKEEALEHYNKAFDIKEDDNLKAAILKITKEIENQKIIDKANEDEIVKRRRDIENGLAFLDDLNLKGEYKVNSFKDIKVRVLQWMKKSNNTNLPKVQDAYLQRTFRRVYESTTKEKDKDDWMSFESIIWQEVNKWCGEERTLSLYKAIREANK